MWNQYGRRKSPHVKISIIPAQSSHKLSILFFLLDVLV
jgi:hypothetical protein